MGKTVGEDSHRHTRNDPEQSERRPKSDDAKRVPALVQRVDHPAE